MSLWTPLDRLGRPNLLPGISAFNPDLEDDKKEEMDARFLESEGKMCECCGASLTEKMRKYLFVASQWWNACPMCFYTENLDLIPDQKKGRLLYMPEVSQTRLNAMLRCFWAITYFHATDPDNITLREMYNTVTAELSNMTTINEKSASVHFSLSDPEILASALYLIPPEDYAQRHKLLIGIRWSPRKNLFFSEIDYWSREDHAFLSSNEIDGNIKSFMSQYMDSNFAVRNMDD